MYLSFLNRLKAMNTLSALKMNNLRKRPEATKMKTVACPDQLPKISLVASNQEE